MSRGLKRVKKELISLSYKLLYKPDKYFMLGNTEELRKNKTHFHGLGSWGQEL